MKHKKDLSFLDKQYIIFNLVTTGIDPLESDIIEISAIKVNRDSYIRRTWQSLVMPTRKIPENITNITGITQKMVENDGEKLEELISEFAKFSGNLRLVTYNAEIYMRFINNAANKCGLTIKNPITCVLNMARRLYPRIDSHSLSDIAGACGLLMQRKNIALNDAELTLAIYEATASRLRSIE